VQDLFVQVTVIIHVKSTLPHKTHGAALLMAGLDGIQNQLGAQLEVCSACVLVRRLF